MLCANRLMCLFFAGLEDPHRIQCDKHSWFSFCTFKSLSNSTECFTVCPINDESGPRERKHLWRDKIKIEEKEMYGNIKRSYRAVIIKPPLLRASANRAINWSWFLQPRESVIGRDLGDEAKINEGALYRRKQQHITVLCASGFYRSLYICLSLLHNIQSVSLTYIKMDVSTLLPLYKNQSKIFQIRPLSSCTGLSHGIEVPCIHPLTQSWAGLSCKSFPAKRNRNMVNVYQYDMIVC